MRYMYFNLLCWGLRMNIKELEDYRASLLAERQSALDAVNARYQRRLDAVGVLLEESEQKVEASHIFKAFFTDINNSFQAVKVAIQETADKSPTFSSETLFAFLNKTFPGRFAKKPSDLSAALWRLRKAGEIDWVTKGKGQVASVYRTTEKYTIFGK
jgi:hypothetical protein